MLFIKNNSFKFDYLCTLFVLSFISEGESIYNGTYVSVKRVPYYVSILSNIFEGTFACGGSIISESWIITAAHCFTSPTQVSVHAGVSTLDYTNLTSNVNKIIVHGDYTSDLLFADIALVELKEPIKFNEYQQPIKIASSLPKEGEKLLVCGTGLESELLEEAYILKTTTLEMMSQEECAKHGAGKSHFCTHDTTSDVCRGDSGGPAVNDGKLVGIVSYGPACVAEDNKDDETKMIAKAYTRVDMFYDWIIKHTGIVYP